MHTTIEIDVAPLRAAQELTGEVVAQASEDPVEDAVERVGPVCDG